VIVVFGAWIVIEPLEPSYTVPKVGAKVIFPSIVPPEEFSLLLKVFQSALVRAPLLTAEAIVILTIGSIEVPLMVIGDVPLTDTTPTTDPAIHSNCPGVALCARTLFVVPCAGGNCNAYDVVTTDGAVIVIVRCSGVVSLNITPDPLRRSKLPFNCISPFIMPPDVLTKLLGLKTGV